jgi:hypothetical protein
MKKEPLIQTIALFPSRLIIGVIVLAAEALTELWKQFHLNVMDPCLIYLNEVLDVCLTASIKGLGLVAVYVLVRILLRV